MPSWLARLWYSAAYQGCFWSWTFLYSYRSQGGHQVPAQGPVLLVANHQSFMDPVLVGLALTTRRVSFLARETLFHNRALAAMMYSLDAMPIDHKGFSREGLQSTLAFLNQGKCVAIFPEGERTHTGLVEDFKPGISLVIKRAKCPIVPIGIAGAFDAWPRTSKFPRLAPLFLPPRKGTIAVSVGKPIEPTVFENLGREEMLAQLKSAVQVEVDRAQHLRRQRRRRTSPPS